MIIIGEKVEIRGRLLEQRKCGKVFTRRECNEKGLKERNPASDIGI